MELAIPGVALGLLYVVTSQSKNKKENFSSRSQLPNVDVPNRNYPEEYPIISPDTDQTSQLSTANKFDGAGGVYTDKYFNPNINSKVNPANPPQYYSLTGDKVDSSYFEHNNMVPYFGSNLRSIVADSNTSEGVLDNYVGAGSQKISKKEQSPLFNPNENLQWSFGAPNMSEFYQSRVNPSNRMANVKPFAEETVAPGLGLGYTTEGAGGYNSGMLMRDHWLDKNVDQLRVATNPKASGHSLLGHEGPANSFIKKTSDNSHMGIMEKHLPDQSFELDNRKSPDDIGRLFTTGGAEKGQTLRPVTVERFVSRPETAISYAGGAGYQNSAVYVPGEYMPSHNQQFGELPFGVANANGRQYANDGEFEIKAKKAYPNNRSSNHQESYFGLVSGSLGAVVAPLLDALRPSRKENVLGTLRPYQNPGTSVPQSYIFNPADRPGTTIRETTENSKFHLNVNSNQLGGAYQVTDQQPVDTYRAETSDFYYAGNASAGARTRQMASYDAGYNQRNNDIKSSTIKGYMVQGNMSLMNSDINMRQISRDDQLKNNRALIGTMPYQSPEISNVGKLAGADNSLYSGIQMDRNTPDIVSALKGNPFVVDYRKAL
jgi:hypothetical protein